MNNMRQFTNGETIVFNGERGYIAKKGARATVVGEDEVYVDVVWEQPQVQNDGKYFKSNFSKLESDSVKS